MMSFMVSLFGKKHYGHVAAAKSDRTERGERGERLFSSTLSIGCTELLMALIGSVSTITSENRFCLPKR